MTIKYRLISRIDVINHGWTAVTWDGRLVGYVRRHSGEWDAKSAAGPVRRCGFPTRAVATAWLMTKGTWEAE